MVRYLVAFLSLLTVQLETHIDFPTNPVLTDKFRDLHHADFLAGYNTAEEGWEMNKISATGIWSNTHGHSR